MAYWAQLEDCFFVRVGAAEARPTRAKERALEKCIAAVVVEVALRVYV